MFESFRQYAAVAGMLTVMADSAGLPLRRGSSLCAREHAPYTRAKEKTLENM